MFSRLRSVFLDMFFPVNFSERNAIPREAWLKKTLRELPNGARILDAGAGELSKKKYCAHLQYVAQDFGGYDGCGDGIGLQTGNWDQSKLDLECDITRIPEPNESFDAILCVEVFEHLPDPMKALDEFARLLRPGGVLILTAPFCSLTHFAPFYFYTGFSQYWYREHLKRRGLEIRELRPNGDFSSYLTQEVGRVPFVASEYCNLSLSPVEKLGIRIVQSLLCRMSQKNSSWELCCFGWQVVARKLGGEDV